MDNEASSSEEKYKVIEYNDQIFRIPVRRINQTQYLFLNDVQAIVPSATALTSADKLIPFETDPATHQELLPKRMAVSEFSSAWQVHVPEAAESRRMLQAMDGKLDRLAQQLRRLMVPRDQSDDTSDGHEGHDDDDDSQVESEQRIEQPRRPESPPPAFTTSPVPTRRVEGDAPPSYETSILGNIKALTDQLRLYESHIANRHKSPRWLARRREWVDREPTNIEQVAYQLVQLEMALLWTAVSESWIQERETWLTLVTSARTERHLAGAMLNLERHTLVMDEAWVNQVRESWTNELLEMIVLPLTHG
ncbi:hypothetical protein BJV82DRAFT_513385 [Fennellomyces sp. T-0311]|nr:hypothetical protein BJV82DRAFT_513385 [Fennellomyces sp. T-0311]